MNVANSNPVIRKKGRLKSLEVGGVGPSPASSSNSPDYRAALDDVLETDLGDGPMVMVNRARALLHPSGRDDPGGSLSLP